MVEVILHWHSPHTCTCMYHTCIHLIDYILPYIHVCLNSIEGLVLLSFKFLNILVFYILYICTDGTVPVYEIFRSFMIGTSSCVLCVGRSTTPAFQRCVMCDTEL